MTDGQSVGGEAELVRRARAGETEALDALFAELREPLYALCLRLTGRRADAEDALQDALLAAFEGFPRFRGESRFRTWAWRIAIRCALRVKARRRRGEGSLSVYEIAAETEDVVERREEARRLAEALDRLGTEHRVVLSLFAVEGLTHAEIADVLGVPEGTVWSRLHRARKKLAELYSPDGAASGRPTGSA